MPVKVYPAPHTADKWVEGYYKPAKDAEDLLAGASDASAAQMKSLVSSSFTIDPVAPPIYASQNGFVDAIYKAYTKHHHLIIRPDDVWIAILSQLNFYINAHAEELRSLFVAHEGKRELSIDQPIATLSTADYADFAQKMANLIGEKVLDPTLQSWVMPSFSTTTYTDLTVSAILFMSTMQEYFKYVLRGGCGLPSVTLLGEREDWENILERVDKLGRFGEETAEWGALLKAVLLRFLLTFDAPEAAETKEFWQKVAHHKGGASQPNFLSGWITAFCFWNKEGQCLYNEWGLDTCHGRGPTDLLILDGITFHRVSAVPAGLANVPVMFKDLATNVTTEMLLVAGSVGVQLGASGAKGIGGPVMDTLQPAVGWWVVEKQEIHERRRIGERIFFV
jgi:hypothetical protein